MSKYVGFLVITMLAIGCINMKKPIPSEVGKVRVQSKQKVDVQSYEIPEGIFRGALWPTPGNSNFQIWMIKGSKDVFFNIATPQGFKSYESETTKDWSFKLEDKTVSKQIFIVSRKDRSKSVTIELPYKKRGYSFDVLENKQGAELIIFMDISETIIDKGLFGYAVIQNP